MKKIISTIIICLLSTIPAVQANNINFGANWKHIGRFSEFKYYVDFNSIKTTNLMINGLTKSFRTANSQPEIVIADMKVEYLKNSRIRQELGVVEAREKWYVHCPTKAYHINAYVWYDGNGEAITSSKLPRALNRSDFDPTFPDTIVNIMATSICQQALYGKGFYLGEESYTLEELLERGSIDKSTYESLKKNK